MAAERRAGDDREAVLGEPRDGEVALDAAAAVEHLRVGDLARPRGRRGCRTAARAARRRPGPRPRSSRTRSRRTAPRASRHARCSAPIAGDQWRPAQPRGRSASSPAASLAAYQFTPLPAGLLAERGAVRRVPLVGGRHAQRPARAALVVGVLDVVVGLVDLADAGERVAGRAVVGAEAPDVHLPQVQRRLAARRSTRPSPCRCRPRRPARGRRSRRPRTARGPPSRRGRTRRRA